MHCVCFFSNWSCGAPALRTHGSFHKILDHIFFKLDCYCHFYYLFSCICCCLLSYFYTANHGINLQSWWNFIFSLGIWTILSLLLPTRSLCLHLFCRFLYCFYHLCCKSCRTLKFLSPGPQYLGWLPFPSAKFWSMAFTYFVLQWQISNRYLSPK